MDMNAERFRNAITKTTKMVAGEGLNVTQTGVRPFVRLDPHTGKATQLNLPAIPDGSPRELMDAVQGYVDHEVAHTYYTESKKADAWMRPHVRDGRNEKLVKGLFNVVEDVRIERLISREYRGAEANLNKAREYISSKLPAMLDEQKAAHAMEGREFGDSDLAMFYLPTYMRALAGQRPSNDLMNEQNLWDMYEPLRAAFPDLEEELNKVETTEDALAITDRFLSLFDDDTPPPPPQEQEGDGEGEGGSGDDDTQKDEKSKPSKDGKSGDGSDDEGSSSGDEDGDDESQGGGGSDDQDDSQDGNDKGEGGQSDASAGGDNGDQGEPDSSQGKPAPSQQPSSSDGDSSETPGGVGGISGLLKETDAPMDFDETMEALIKDRTVQAFEDAEGPVEFMRDIDRDRELDMNSHRAHIDVQKVEEKVTQTVGAMQKELQRVIAARSLTVKSPGMKSGKLHGPSLHRLMRNDDRVFYRKQENRSNDVAVSLLIDCSGSMCGREIEVAGQAAWAFAEVLERIGVKSEINGFSTQGYGDIEYSQAEANLRQFMDDTNGEIDRGRIRTLGSLNIPFKSFDERFGRPVKERLAVTQGGRLRGYMQGNCDYIAVRQALFRLAVRKESRKILFVFSDGYPACSLAPDVAAKALKGEVEQAPKFGVETIGIGICSDSVEHFYPNHAVINNVGELPSVTMSHLRRMLLK